jgi:ribulose 1,5-bisphosphate synthetase/thiazole synthase
MTDHVIETEVLVVGSGPAGAASALFLATYVAPGDCGAALVAAMEQLLHPGVVVRTAGEASASVGA